MPVTSEFPRDHLTLRVCFATAGRWRHDGINFQAQKRMQIFMKSARYCCPKNQNWKVSTNLSLTRNIIFNENPVGSSRIAACGRTDRLTYGEDNMRIFLNAPKNEVHSSKKTSRYRYKC